MKTSTTSQKQTSATFEKSFFKLVFLNFLSIRKDYYKIKQFSLKPPTENDTDSFREPAFLSKHFFRNT